VTFPADPLTNNTAPRRRPAPRTLAAVFAVAVVTTLVVVLGGPIRPAVAGDGTPQAPTAIASTPGWRYDAADVAWTAPADDGGSPITRYLVDVSTDGGATWAKAGWSVITRGTYPCGGGGAHCIHRVTAHNAAGDGPPSAPSAPVTVPDPPYSPPAPTITRYTVYRFTPGPVPHPTYPGGGLNGDNEAEQLNLTWVPGVSAPGTGPGTGVTDRYTLQGCYAEIGSAPSCEEQDWENVPTTATATTYLETHQPCCEHFNYWYRVLAVNDYGSATSEPEVPLPSDNP
jgi:hypothetical protein